MAIPLQFQTLNNFAFTLQDGKLIVLPDLSGAVPTFQGQLVVWDATLNGGNGGVRPAAAQADLANFVGVAEQNSQLNSLGDILPTVCVGFQGVYYFNTTAAEVYKFGTKVFYNETVPQIVPTLPAQVQPAQVTSSTNAGARTVAVGFVILPNEKLLAGISSITGAAGLQVPVAVVANWPTAGLA